MTETTEHAESLRVLHDRLRYTLEDVTGRFYHEDEFERVFDAAIAEVEALTETTEHRCSICWGPYGKSAIRCPNEPKEADRG